ncbi:MAG TPA: tetratricopeptide repeat protein [Gemmataceae bacterium]|nr:tetratricopeptide repeat protein [Gemmataceae bacterium]
MKCAEILAALTIRRVVIHAPQLVGAAEEDTSAEDLFSCCPPHMVTDALRASLRRAWLCLELLLAGEDVWAQVRSKLLSEEDRDDFSSLLHAGSPSSGSKPDAELRRRCWNSLQSARQAGLLDSAEMALPTAIHLSIRLNHTSNWGDFRQAEWHELERLGEAFRLGGHGELRPILELRWHGRDPLLIVLTTALFRQALEKEKVLFTNGQAAELLDGSTHSSIEDGREQANFLDRQENAIAQCLDAARSRSEVVDVAAAAARLERGLGHLQRGEYERAIAELTASLGLNPSLAAAYANRGEARRLTGDYEQAVSDYDSAHLLAPSDARVLFNRGMVQWILGRVDAALADFSACLRVDPSNAVAWTHRGAAHADKGALEPALADFTRALQLDPSSQLAYQKRGDVHIQLGDPARAIADYNQAAKLNPFCALTCIKRGDAYRAKGEYDRALADYTAALRLDPLNSTAYVNRASTYRLRGQNDLALNDLNQAVRLDRNNSQIWFERALAYRVLNQFGPSLDDFDQALQLSPSDAEMLLQRGCTHQLNGDFDNALADFDATVRLKPNYALAYHSRGTLYVSRGNIDEGIVDFRSALRCDPSFGQAYLSRASAWSKKGRFDKAVNDCNEALERDPGLAGAHIIRASAFVQQGAYEEAAADLSHVLAADANNAQVYHLRGMAAMKQGQYDEALADFNTSLKLNPSNARTLFLRGTVYQHREQHPEALADFQQAVLLDPSYTAAYCNQRALLHAAQGDYELALADYAIVLQLDRTNVTALLGREHALEGLQERANQQAASPPSSPTIETTSPPSGNDASPAAQPSAAPSTRAIRRKKRSKTDPHITPPTHVHRASKETDTFPVVPGPLPTAATPESTIVREPAAETMQAPPADLVKIEELAAESLIDEPQEAPALRGETAPDRAVAPPQTGSTFDLALEPKTKESAVEKSKVVGPIEARTERDKKQEEASERAKLWAEMRHRERQKDQTLEEREQESEPRSSGSTRLLRRTLVIVVGLLLLGSLGYGAYVLIAGGDLKRTAEQVWTEYDQDLNAANKRYRGRFVQVSGKLHIYKDEKTTQFFFESPAEDAKWSIVFLPKPKDAAELKEGQDITIRGKFAPNKKPDKHLVLSNISILQK